MQYTQASHLISLALFIMFYFALRNTSNYLLHADILVANIIGHLMF